MITTDPVLDAIVAGAVDATGANAGWLLDLDTDRDELVVVAAYGPGTGRLLGERIPASAGSAGFVVASGQPVAIAPHPDDTTVGEGVAGVAGIKPTAVLCVPCSTDTAVQGALELVDKSGGGPFSFDDVEVATLVAGIAGPALAGHDPDRAGVASPEELAGLLGRLASADAARYATVATFVRALLDQA